MPYTIEDNIEHDPDFNPMDNIHSSIKRRVDFDDEGCRVILKDMHTGVKQLSSGNYRGSDPEFLRIHNDAKK